MYYRSVTVVHTDAAGSISEDGEPSDLSRGLHLLPPWRDFACGARSAKKDGAVAASRAESSFLARANVWILAME